MINLNILHENKHLKNAALYTDECVADIQFFQGKLSKIANTSINSNIYYVSNGTFSLHQIIKSILELSGPAAALYFSTFSITEVPFITLSSMHHAGNVKKIYALLDHRARANYPDIFTQIKNISENVGVTKVHAKVSILEFDNKYISIIGSSNWTCNPRIETGFIIHDYNIGAINKDWILQNINKYKI